jgi:hypothetical protein
LLRRDGISRPKSTSRSARRSRLATAHANETPAPRRSGPRTRVAATHPIASAVPEQLDVREWELRPRVHG